MIYVIYLFYYTLKLYKTFLAKKQTRKKPYAEKILRMNLKLS